MPEIKILLDKNVKRQIIRTVRKYLHQSDYQVFIFGSRVVGENRRFSDIDIGILGPKIIPGHVLIEIQEELENSRIPFRIDVVDFQRVSGQFRDLALKKVIVL